MRYDESTQNKEGYMVRIFLITVLIVFSISGCSSTWKGAKEDTGDAYKWSKEKVHDGAGYVEEKTEE